MLPVLPLELYPRSFFPPSMAFPHIHTIHIHIHTLTENIFKFENRLSSIFILDNEMLPSLLDTHKLVLQLKCYMGDRYILKDLTLPFGT